MYMKQQLCLAVLIGGLIGADAAFAKNGDIKAEGILSALSATSATVAGATYVIDAQTDFENANGADISPSAFSVGDRVEIKGPRVNGVLIARELELQADLTPGSGASPSPSASPSASPSPSPTLGDDRGHHGNGDDSGHGGNQGGGKSGKGSGGNSQESRLRAKMSRVEGSLAGGKLDYRVESKETRLSVNVKIPLPSTLPAIADSTAAAAAALEVALSRSGVEYAVCDLAYNTSHDDDHDDDSLHAEYRVDVRQRTGRSLREKKGSCDTDLAVEGIQAGIPAVEVGDTLSVRLEGGASFLTGTVQRKK